jgi:D-alanyl-D-alanine endopeptidase (penicillin-binding protein 7)
MKKFLVYLLSALLVSAAPMARSAVSPQDEGQAKPATVAHKHTIKHKHKRIVRHKKKAPVRHHKHVAAVRPASAAVEKQAAVSVPPVPTAPPQVLAKEERQFSQDLNKVPPAGLQDPPGVNRKLALRSAVVLVVDQNTGQALYAKNPDMQTPIASITKLMTAVVVLDAGLSMSEPITITEADVDRLKHSSSRLPVGATLTRGEMLHLALIASENRAAAALARTYPGGRDACIRAMNRKAAELGMTSTHYVEATGLNSGNQSTAVDLAKLVNVASRYPLIHQITTTGEYGIELPGYRVVKVRQHGKLRRVSREVERHVAFHNTNVLTRNPDWEIGLSKTGFINEAGHCLVMQTKIADRKVIMVLLDSEGKMSRIGDAARVRRWLELEGAAVNDAT